MSNTQTHSSPGPQETARQSALPSADGCTLKCLECYKILPGNANLCDVCQESTRYSSVIPALDDDDNSIRLLQSNQEVSADGHDEQRLHFHLSVHSRNAAPAYNAISYTWGDRDDMDSILLDGHALPVTQNCRYALWQAQLHHPGTHKWIDAVCIDQTNDVEKSSQVARMADLYARADCVLMCVGRDVLDLELIAAGLLDDQRVQDVIGYNANLRGPAPSELELAAEDVLESWQLSSLADYPVTTAVYAAVCSAYESLLECSYFNRLWVYQEFTSSRQREVLHGPCRLMDYWVNRIISLCRIGMTSPKNYPISWRISAGPSTVSLESITAVFGELECADPRDRIFGIIGLVDWSNDPPIKPDYSLSRFELACILSDRTTDRLPYSLDLDWLKKWLVYFQVNEHDPGKQRMLSARTAPGSSSNALHGLLTPPLRLLHTWIHVWPALERHTSGQLAVPELQECNPPEDEGGARSYRTSRRLLCHETYLASLSNAVTSSPLRSPVSHQPLMLYVGSVCVGYLCSDARPGDVVASFQPARNDDAELHLVLREDGTSENTPNRTFFMVVGQAVMATDTIHHDFPVATKRLWGLETNLSVEDWAILWYQALPRDGTDGSQVPLVDHQASAGRLYTSVSDLSKSGPRFFVIQPNEYYRSPSEGLRES
ncbi:hypothetical protein LTR56_013738 [Elasticomyces elasticus]|nr:hypothetical protein LTR22_022838 [Elasticomyces elasticus]KAK3637203.1 hypothetical protein LTR56_013738 [Elasticomyces elasticus]KAK4907554.1 hypothetical protein LTR49_023421 [Elasticomyces elasticus]KAK5755302.1 hypothetical protein LTS12_014644 [Elasticomyces elasticus]